MNKRIEELVRIRVSYLKSVSMSCVIPLDIVSSDSGYDCTYKLENIRDWGISRPTQDETVYSIFISKDSI